MFSPNRTKSQIKKRLPDREAFIIKEKQTEMNPMEVKIIRSRRRKRTISARVVGKVMHVHAPENIPDDKLKKVVEDFKTRFEKRKIKKELKSKESLEKIGQRLNKRYFGGRLKVSLIKYVTNQNKQFGSCNYRTGTIRLSHRLAEMPEWVRDYVLLHEMAHIIEPNHSKSFWELVSRYKLAERARGYLIAKGMEMEEDVQD
ncbi:MAG: M48 family metallopeptidase [Nitrospirae bacterium]|nr:M48 family metallopeptidase [Nitrospirota bacterium]